MVRHPVKLADSSSALGFTSVCSSPLCLSGRCPSVHPPVMWDGLIICGVLLNPGVKMIGPMRQLALQAE